MGRRKGVKHQPQNEQQFPLPRCPNQNCQSTQLEVLRIVKERDLHGFGPDNLPHTSVSWRRCRCKECGCMTTIQHYTLDVSMWVGDADPRQFNRTDD